MSFGGVACFGRVMVTLTDSSDSLVVLAVNHFMSSPSVQGHDDQVLVVIALSVPLHYLFQCLGPEPRALHMLKIST